MKFLKHILVVVALLFMAMPCTHALDHEHHDHGAEAQAEICASHACACHAHGDAPCSDSIDIPQFPGAVSDIVGAAPLSFTLFVFTETKPVLQKTPLPVRGFLATIQTVQLLI